MNRYEFKQRAAIDITPIIIPIKADGILAQPLDIDNRTRGVFDGPFDHRLLDDVQVAAQRFVTAELEFQAESPENYVLSVTLSSNIGYGPVWQDYNVDVWFQLRHKNMVQHDNR